MQEENFGAEAPAGSQTTGASPNAGKPSIGQRLSAFTGKQWVLFGIAAFTALFMLIGLSFPVVHFKQEIFGVVLERTVLGFDVLGGNMPNAIESVAVMLMVFVWLQLLATVACIVLMILTLTTFSQKRAARVQDIVMIVSAVFSLLYLIDGIAAMSASEIAGTTAAYALFIVVALLTVGYFVCRKILPETFGPQSPKQGKRPKQNGEDVAEQIKKYKELCDMGAITEEEYAKKKSELLNGMD